MTVKKTKEEKMQFFLEEAAAYLQKGKLYSFVQSKGPRLKLYKENFRPYFPKDNTRSLEKEKPFVYLGGLEENCQNNGNKKFKFEGFFKKLSSYQAHNKLTLAEIIQKERERLTRKIEKRFGKEKIKNIYFKESVNRVCWWKESYFDINKKINQINSSMPAEDPTVVAKVFEALSSSGSLGDAENDNYHLFVTGVAEIEEDCYSGCIKILSENEIGWIFYTKKTIDEFKKMFKEVK